VWWRRCLTIFKGHFLIRENCCKLCIKSIANIHIKQKKCKNRLTETIGKCMMKTSNRNVPTNEKISAISQEKNAKFFLQQNGNVPTKR